MLRNTRRKRLLYRSGLSGTGPVVRDVIENRILALSRAHNRLNRESWSSVTLREIIRERGSLR